MYGGLCTDGIGSFICTCEPGHAGKLCDQLGCAPSQCVHGNCASDNTTCECNDGWSGYRCDLPFLITCENGGTTNGSSRCICAPGFIGNRCERQSCLKYTGDNYSEINNQTWHEGIEMSFAIYPAFHVTRNGYGLFIESLLSWRYDKEAFIVNISMRCEPAVSISIPNYEWSECGVIVMTDALGIQCGYNKVIVRGSHDCPLILPSDIILAERFIGYIKDLRIQDALIFGKDRCPEDYTSKTEFQISPIQPNGSTAMMTFVVYMALATGTVLASTAGFALVIKIYESLLILCR